MTKKLLFFISFSLFNLITISAQSLLLEQHELWEDVIKTDYPGLGKKNSDGSYTIHTTEEISQLDVYLKDINHAYGQGAMFMEDGIKSRPYCERTITVSKTKIVIKLHDVLMLAPDVREVHTSTSRGGSAVKPKDPYTQYLGCKGGNRIIKNGGLVFSETTYSEDQTIVDIMHGQEPKPLLIGCKATTTCSHSSRRIPVSRTGKRYDRTTGTTKIVGGYNEDASSDFLSPYRFDHHQTIVYNLTEMAKQNNVSLDQLVKAILMKDLSRAIVGDNFSEFYFTEAEICYIKRFLWNLYGFSVSKINANIQAEQKKVAEKKEKARVEQQRQRTQISNSVNNDLEKTLVEFRGIEINKNPYEAYRKSIELENNCYKLYEQAVNINDSNLIQKIKIAYANILQLKGIICYLCHVKGDISETQFNEDYNFVLSHIPDILKGQLKDRIATIATREHNYADGIKYYSEALNYYQTIDDLRKEYPDVLTALGYCYAKVNNEEKAMEMVEKALEIKPDGFYQNDTKGVIYVLFDQKKKAKNYWNKIFLPKFGEEAKTSIFYKGLKKKGIITE